MVNFIAATITKNGSMLSSVNWPDNCFLSSLLNQNNHEISISKTRGCEKREKRRVHTHYDLNGVIVNQFIERESKHTTKKF